MTTTTDASGEIATWGPWRCPADCQDYEDPSKWCHGCQEIARLRGELGTAERRSEKQMRMYWRLVSGAYLADDMGDMWRDLRAVAVALGVRIPEVDGEPDYDAIEKLAASNHRKGDSDGV